MKTALTIAGSDSSGGAGIQADIKTFQAHGVFGMSAVTAVTVQNTRGVFGVQDIRPDIVRDQILCLFDDIEVHALKIGMVPNAEVIEAVADALSRINRSPVILDPVMVSTSGYDLMRQNARDALIRCLFPLCDLVTPNLTEVETLTGKSVQNVEQMKTAAWDILELGAPGVVIKGGHLTTDAVDVVCDGSQLIELKSERVDTRNTHGTGCTFSAAIAANMATGYDFFESIRRAKAYVTGALKHAFPLGKGYGPTHHFYDVYARAGMESS